MLIPKTGENDASCRIMPDPVWTLLEIEVTLPSNRQYLSWDACLEVKREDNQNCCVRQLCTMICAQMQAVVSVLWIGICHTGCISLCIDLYLSVCFLCFSFLLHICYSIVSTVGLTRWDWSLFLRTKLPLVVWHCRLGHLTHKNPSPIWPMCLVGR